MLTNPLPAVTPVTRTNRGTAGDFNATDLWARLEVAPGAYRVSGTWRDAAWIRTGIVISIGVGSDTRTATSSRAWRALKRPHEALQNASVWQKARLPRERSEPDAVVLDHSELTGPLRAAREGSDGNSNGVFW